jgi:hypothetical protein
MAFCASGIWEGRSGGPVSGGMEDDLGDKVENAWTVCVAGDASARMGRSAMRFGVFMVLMIVDVDGMVCWCAYLVRL